MTDCAAGLVCGCAALRLRHGQAAHDAAQKVLCEGSGRVIGVAQRLQGAARGAREQVHHAALAGRKVQPAGNAGVNARAHFACRASGLANYASHPYAEILFMLGMHAIIPI